MGMPTVGANLRGIPASCTRRRCQSISSFSGLKGSARLCAARRWYHRTFNSIKVKPLPALTRRLYLTVGHLTIGRSLSTGRGATADALARRACRRRCLRPGFGEKRSGKSEGWGGLGEIPGRSGLELDAANPCGNLRHVSTIALADVCSGCF